MQGEEREGLEGTLERLLADAACAGEQWELEERDPDILADPIMQLDIQVCQVLKYALLYQILSFMHDPQAHLVQYLRKLSQQSCFLSFSSYLTSSEQHTLAALQ